MNLTCPYCKKSYDYREATRDHTLLGIIAMQGDFAPHGLLVLEYVKLFGTTHPLKPLKLKRLFDEVREFYVRGRFNCQRTCYAISKKGVAEALRLVCNQIDGPLTAHNYLKKVMVSIAKAECEEQSREAEKKLREKEDRLRMGGMRDGECTRTESRDPAIVKAAIEKMPWNKGEG